MFGLYFICTILVSSARINQMQLYHIISCFTCDLRSLHELVREKLVFDNFTADESSRVCLQPIRGVDGSDYINANFIHVSKSS